MITDSYLIRLIIHHTRCIVLNRAAWLDECIATAHTFDAITREQFAEAAKQLMDEFTANDGYGTSASATFLALCFGNLELRLFGLDGDKNG